MPEWVQYITTAIAAASAIAAVTPTPKDDRALRKFYKIVDLIAINIGRAKER